jgi:16S rRNA (cytosine1402-N4)-methyltransferase
VAERLTGEVVHLPVMQSEVMEMLNPRQNGIYVDATVGLGGHAENILKAIGSGGRYFGIDRDGDALNIAEKRLSDKRVTLKRGSFSDMESLLSSEGVSEVDGVLFDLGLSMIQLRNHERGFSFISEKRLDMRMDRGQRMSAWDVVNKYSVKDIERVLRDFGEEPLSKKIASAVVSQRSKKTIDTCSGLSKIIEGVYRGRGRIHPATRTFQALRIEVNKELDQLRAGLEAAVRLLRPGGRLCVIAYHSLEDRIIKFFLLDNAKSGLLIIITKKPLTPQPGEKRLNPSSRSAKLRAAEKV